MILYRAMCIEEANKTLAEQKPVFNKRFKWFSNQLSFIKNRVKDGTFAHSQYKFDPYFVILKFIVEPSDMVEFARVNNKEFMLDVRMLIMVRFRTVEELTFGELGVV